MKYSLYMDDWYDHVRGDVDKEMTQYEDRGNPDWERLEDYFIYDIPEEDTAMLFMKYPLLSSVLCQQ